MKRFVVFPMLAVALAVTLQDAFALSEKLHRPRIFWPKNYDTNIAAQVERVLNADRFKYLDGMTSYWEPKWSTTLVYDGNAQALSTFIKALNGVPGMRVRVTFSRDLSKESRGSLSAGSWWVEYAHTTPDATMVRVNLAAESLDPERLELTLPKGETKDDKGR